MRRRLRRAPQGCAFARDREARPAGAHQSRAPRRLWQRGEHGRRRRNPAADARPVPAARGRAARVHAAAARRLRRGPDFPAPRPRGAHPDRDADGAGRARGRAARDRLARRADRHVDARRQRRGGRAGLPADAHRPRDVGPARPPGSGCPGVRAQALRDPEAHRARRRRAVARGPAGLLRGQPVVADADLQGHADGEPDRADVRRPPRSGRRVGARAGPPALQHQHVSRRGRWRIPTGSSRTTARSTRSAATSTG